MAKHRGTSIQGNLEDYTVSTDTPDASLDIQAPITYNNSEQRTAVVCIYPATVVRDGQITGEHYVWNGAGSVVSVRTEDVPELLSLRLGATGCCGATAGGNQLFQLP